MTDTVFQPRVLSRDAADTLISAAIGLLQTAILFVLPGVLIHHFTGSIAFALIVGFGLYGLFMLMCVTNLVVSEAGLRLTRTLGGPGLIPWSEITSIHEATRAELIVHGWLWPLMPPRELTPSLTSTGHYRIQFGKEWIYFPPAEPEAFMESVGRYLKARP